VLARGPLDITTLAENKGRKKKEKKKQMFTMFDRLVVVI